MRILLCTDGSPHGQAALRFGALLVRASSEPATLLGVLEHPEDRLHLEEALQEGQGFLAGASAPTTKIRQGHAAEQILEEAASGVYDLVVVGARGRRGITRFILGSTSERIARHASVPVIISQGERKSLQRVLVCTAMAEPGLAAVELGGRVAGLVGAQVTVLHVMSQLAATPDLPAVLLEDLEASAEVLIAHDTPEGAHLERALKSLADLGIEAQARVRHGLVVEEVLAETCDGDYDLVVIGAHTAAGWMRFLLDDIAHQIISHTDRPILVTKPNQILNHP
jgi:nucleotide-binding universal stress UspA family protein